MRGPIRASEASLQVRDPIPHPPSPIPASNASLLTGPAGSGKTAFVLDSLRRALGEDPAAVRLLTPTATMAEHIRNQMAREGLVFSPGVVMTLARFVGQWAGKPRISSGALFLIVERVLARLQLPAFASVAHMPGFCASLARTIEEFSSVGLTSALLEASPIPHPPSPIPASEASNFRRVFEAVEREIEQRGFALQGERMRQAAERIRIEGLGGIRTIWMDGFYSLTDPELGVIAAMGRHAGLTLTLPCYQGTTETRDRLLALGFQESACDHRSPQPPAEIHTARTIDDEARHIARLVTDEVAQGREFRDIGVLVRSPENYLNVLRAAFERAGIPARFYFDPPMASHGSVRFLSAVIGAMLGGWDWEDTLAAVRQSGIPSDRFDFIVRERLPGRGLPNLCALAGSNSRVLQLLDTFQSIESWRKLEPNAGRMAKPPYGPGRDANTARAIPRCESRRGLGLAQPGSRKGAIHRSPDRNRIRLRPN